MKTKVFGYVRVSGQGQLKGHGPQRQRDNIESFSQRNGFEVVQYFQDAYTGTEEDRPAFIALLEAVHVQSVRFVVVESLDRFARDMMVQNQLLAKLLSYGVTLVLANTGHQLNTETLGDDPMMKAMVQMQGVFAELDKDLTVRKLKLARDKKRQLNGRCEGVKPYGSLDGEKQALKLIVGLRKNGLSYQRIADRLNLNDVPSRGGGSWHKGTVGKILQRMQTCPSSTT